MTEEAIKKILPHLCYTKEEVDVLIRAAVEEARAIDEASMAKHNSCLLYTSPSPRDRTRSRMPSSA